MIEMLSAERMKDLAAVSLGEEEADLVIRGVDLVNVYTGRSSRILRVDKGEMDRLCRA